MKNLFQKRNFRFLFLTLLFTAAASLICIFGFPFVSSGTNLVTLGLSQVSAAAAENISKPSYEELQTENAQLREEVASLRQQLTEYYDLKEENEKLWSFYNIKKENPSYTYVPASVVRRDAAGDFYTFVIDAGTVSGISKEDPVITENGLIGVVTAADARTAMVKTVLSPEVKVGVWDKTTKDTGIVSGSAQYCDDNRTLLSKLSADHKIKKGDIIVTSGVGGKFPPNLILGKVQELSYDTYDATQYAVVQPYEDIRKVTNVLVITDFDNKGQISSFAQSSVQNTQPASSVPQAQGETE